MFQESNPETNKYCLFVFYFSNTCVLLWRGNACNSIVSGCFRDQAFFKLGGGRGEGLQGGGGEEGKSLQKLLQKLGNLEIYGKVLRGS